MVNIKQGDYGDDLNFTLTDSDGSAIDLTSNTGITFRMKNTTGKSKLITGSCSVTVAADGTCYYTVVDGDTDEVGTYDFEVEVSYSGKVITATGDESIVIIAQLG